MTGIFKFLLIFFLTLPYLFPFRVFANEAPRAESPRFSRSANNNCGNRYLTIVNPVRGRPLWKESGLEPIYKQYGLVKKHDFSATWLLQYDALKDKELIAVVKNFDSKQEPGVFLEVSPDLAGDSRVIYPYDSEWSGPEVIFLSAYKQSERRRMIDKLFSEFKNQFGYFPKSVGAWWIDSYSLGYLKRKYAISAALVVSDQRSTDKYGVWGQWWGYPYYPAKANILVPANSLENKENVVVLQWALRDLSKAYGEGKEHSNNSLQANDYISLGLDTDYFKNLLNVYLDCGNPLGQVTVGLETGIEGSVYHDEFSRQLEALSKMPLQSVTMDNFATVFSKVYPDFPREVTLRDGFSVWNLNTKFRSNGKLGDLVVYNQNQAFKDYFVADKNKFLNRKLEQEPAAKPSFSAWFLIAYILLGLFAFRTKKFKVFAVSVLFSVAAFGPVLRSFENFGWRVFFGPEVINLEITQTAIVLGCFLMVFIISKKFRKMNLWLVPLTFAFEPLIGVLRYSQISGWHLFGAALDSLKFAGFAIQNPLRLTFVLKDLPAYQAHGLLRLNFDKIWNNPALSLFYPLAHILAAFVLWYLLQRTGGKAKFLTSILIMLFLWHIFNVFSADPRIAIPE